MIVQEVIDYLNEFNLVEVRDYHFSIGTSILDGKSKSYCVSIVFDE